MGKMISALIWYSSTNKTIPPMEPSILSKSGNRKKKGALLLGFGSNS